MNAVSTALTIAFLEGSFTAISIVELLSAHNAHIHVLYNVAS